MDPFVRRLVQRLFEPQSGLSRNRHFHTFDNDEGRAALKIAKRLKALAGDMSRCEREGGTMRVSTSERGETIEVELRVDRLRIHRVACLARTEYELLLLLPNVPKALSSQAA